MTVLLTAKGPTVKIACDHAIADKLNVIGGFHVPSTTVARRMRLVSSIYACSPREGSESVAEVLL